MVNDISLGLSRFWLANYSDLTVHQVAVRVLQKETWNDESSITSCQGTYVGHVHLPMVD
jgi:hypothetical protein